VVAALGVLVVGLPVPAVTFDDGVLLTTFELGVVGVGVTMAVTQTPFCIVWPDGHEVRPPVVVAPQDWLL